MIKYVALGLLFSACGLAGAFLTRAMQCRVRELEALLRMLTALRTRIQFSRVPLRPLLEEVCAEGPPAFLPRCVAGMREGEPFPAAWRGAVERQGGFGLREEDRRLLRSLGELLGSTDAEGQREGLLLHEGLARQLLEEARARRDSKGKAFFSLGILAGLTLLILFI
ncbi:MAG: stage III sporulation protein AB [Oscillospiraceae bacterium]|nr:stage III sporulation protein AB [Oscillospiraceae bacterium]